MTVLDWRYVPGRGYDHPRPLVRAYCEGCERYSRPVRVPTDADVAHVRERTGIEHPVVNPSPPPGWENGCPRCDR